MKGNFAATVIVALASLTSSTLANDIQWFPFTYSDLQPLNLSKQPYKNAWRDLILKNNAFYTTRHDIRFAFGNAPATEAHFLIEAKSQSRILIVTVLNSVEACEVLAQDPSTKTTLKYCPIRLLMQDHENHKLQDAGNGCLVEYGAPSYSTPVDFQRNAMFARYELADNSLKLDIRFQGALQDRCATTISLPIWP